MNRTTRLVVPRGVFPTLVLAVGDDMGTIRGKIDRPDQIPCRGVVSLWVEKDGRVPAPRPVPAHLVQRSQSAPGS
jgi:hypothetical protein